MLYSDLSGDRLSRLGFGTMRLPQLADGKIDEATVERMVADAIGSGVNLFDTAWPYHDGESERVIGRVLAKYPRDSYYLSNKYPGHQISASYDPAALFEAQLKKCGVEYFDYYLLHNVYENSLATYLDQKWGILSYFKEQKKLGRIRHLGFSSHAELPMLKQILELIGEDMEFCLIQLNYLDWSLQSAKEKYELLQSKGIPVWVMEPLRGGKLSSLSDKNQARLDALGEKDSPSAYAFRFLAELPGVQVVLSGMSSETQMKENLKTFETERPLSPKARETLFAIAKELGGKSPCTACRYCVKECPLGLDIPRFLSLLSELRYAPVTNAVMRFDGLKEDQRPSACLACGKCAEMCPQKIDIPSEMAALDALMKNVPSWAEICRQREAAQGMK